MFEPYRCTECGEVTSVRVWPATRLDPADSTWGDGCSSCGGVLADEPLPVDEVEAPDAPGPEWDDVDEGLADAEAEREHRRNR